MLALNPEVVLICGPAAYGPADLLQDPKWQGVRAVKDRRVFKAFRAATWSPRVVVLAWWMARCFYPQAIPAEEVEKAADRFYHACFGIRYEGGQ
jgi:iron complex transport system substrate-binding protein